DRSAFKQLVTTSVSDIVRQQVEAGIDIVNDGELSKPSFNTYVADRLAGYEARPNPAAAGFPFGDWQDFPGWAASAPLRNAALVNRPVCVGELAWKDRGAIDEDIANLTTAGASAGAAEAFMTSASVGTVGYTFLNQYYPDEKAYYYALADVLRDEYRA